MGEVDQYSLDEIWTKVQEDLSRQMTRATYDTLLPRTRLLLNGNGVYRIEAGTRESLEWLENRLKEQVIRTFSNLIGHPVSIEFVLAAEPAASPEPCNPVGDETDCIIQDVSVANQPLKPVSVLSACARFAREVDFQNLWFAKGRSSGYTQAADYWFQFWMLFLNTIKARAFDVWFRIVSDDKRNIYDESFTHWTPPRKYSFKELGRVVGTKSIISIRGGPRSCWLNEQTKKLTGAPLPGCCQKYSPTRWHETANHTIHCEHWQTGILEVLYREGLIAIEIIKPPPGKPRSHEMRIQAWRNLPLLTPRQVSRLSELDQIRHNHWIERYGHLQNIDLARWEQLTDSYSLIPLLPDYDLKPETCPDCQGDCQPGCACRCHKSRQLWQPFEPSREWFQEDEDIDR